MDILILFLLMSLDKVTKELLPHKNLLNQSLVGIEREALRVSTKDNKIAQTDHSIKFGSPLTNSFITTDFSESLLEIVTPPFSDVDDLFSFLTDLTHYVYYNLRDDEYIWHQSMPCSIDNENSIKVADYGKSNLGMMKKVYRNGLANRYGKIMQVISGVHFNYSYSNEFWLALQNILKSKLSIKEFINEKYMSLIRNVFRYDWLLIYLFGASPAICPSYVGYRQQGLSSIMSNTFYGFGSTSLRMGDIGYQNIKEEKCGVKLSYDSLNNYINSLKEACKTPCPSYFKYNKENQQLNYNVLQIENEYYADARIKQKQGVLDKLTDVLSKEGVGYLELRLLDINPYSPVSITKDQVYFIEIFLLFCLLENSPNITEKQNKKITAYNMEIANSGRVSFDITKSKILKKGSTIFTKMYEISHLFSKKHQKSLSDIHLMFLDNNLLLSSQFLSEIKKDKLGFSATVEKISKKYQDFFKKRDINEEFFQKMDKISAESFIKQKNLENKKKQPFTSFFKRLF